VLPPQIFIVILIRHVPQHTTTRHELRAFPAQTENVSVCELVNHGAL